MKTIFKKLSTFLVVLVIFAGSMFTLAACGSDPDDPEDTTKIMNVAVNPSIEFVLDEDEKVLSFSASNEDGAFLLEKFSAFTGMEAEDAALKVLELAEEYGFVISGKTDGQTFTVSVSGAEAQDIYNDVKEKVNSKATEFGLSIANLVKISKDDMQDMIAECYQEYSNSQIANMNEEELIELLKKSREETAGLVSLDEKQEYYMTRAEEVLSAKFDAIDTFIEANQSILGALLTPYITAMETAYDDLIERYTALKADIAELKADNGLDTAYETYIAAKKTYFEQVEAYKTALESGSATVIATAEANLAIAKSEADAARDAMNIARGQIATEIASQLTNFIHSKIAALNTQIDLILAQISLTSAEIQTKINDAVAALKLEYTNNATNPWEEPAA